MNNLYGVTGMPLSGKSEAAEILRENGFATLEMGDVVRIEKKERNLDRTEESFVEAMREKHGKDAIARLSLPYFEKVMDEKEKIAIMGLRSLEEKHYFEDELDTEIDIISIWASPETREERRKKRGREDDEESLYSRDAREIDYGIGGLIAKSDYLIKNNGSLEDFREKVADIVN